MKSFIYFTATLLIASGCPSKIGAAAETNAASALMDASMAPVAKADLLPTMPRADSTMSARHPRLRTSLMRAQDTIDALYKNKSATTTSQHRQLAGDFWVTLAMERPLILLFLLLLGAIASFLIFIFLFVILPFQLFVWVWYWCWTPTTRADPQEPAASSKNKHHKNDDENVSGEESSIATASSIGATIDSGEERDHDNNMVDIDL